jgi:peptidoglycan-associated lipoprotein
VLLIMVALVVGCGHRTSRGMHHYAKKHAPPSASVKSPMEKKVDPSNPVKGNGSGGYDGYFPIQEGTFSDILQDEPLIFEDPQQDKIFELASGQDYWVNRVRAEQLTAQSGLEDVFFEFDSFQLTEQAKAVLSANAEWIIAHPEAVVTIEGHCDDRGTQAYNHILGEKRALRTKAFLTSLGVNGKQLQTMTYGKDNPACLDGTEACYRKNRRAHLVLGVGGTSTAMHLQ